VSEGGEEREEYLYPLGSMTVREDILTCNAADVLYVYSSEKQRLLLHEIFE
jgi:hypothetical protein